jgi:hypothetical protein
MKDIATILVRVLTVYGGGVFHATVFDEAEESPSTRMRYRQQSSGQVSAPGEFETRQTSREG